MISQPKVSIIIPIYNVEQFVENCVSSALNQTYKNIEIILIDDGSTDSSSVICEGLIENYSQADLFHKPNGGLSSARNFGLSKAKGQFVFFLDGDDQIDSHAIENLVELALKHDVDLVTSQLIKIAENNSFEGSTNNDGVVVSGSDLLRMMLLLNGESGSACGKLISTKQFDGLSFPEGQLFEDFGVMATVFSKTPHAFVSKSKLYGYTTRRGSITGQKSYDNRHVKGMEASIKVVESVVSDLPVDLSNELFCYKAFGKLRVASKLSKQMLRENKWAKDYETLSKKYARSLVFKNEVPVVWRLRCLLYGVSTNLYSSVYNLYGWISGKVVG